MLEERLTRTYAQHNLGGQSAVGPAGVSYQPMQPYGSNVQGGAESFYRDNGPSQPGQPHPYSQIRAPFAQQIGGAGYPDLTTSQYSGAGPYPQLQAPQGQGQPWNQPQDQSYQMPPPQPTPSHYAGSESAPPGPPGPPEQPGMEGYYGNYTSHDGQIMNQHPSAVSEAPHTSSPTTSRNPQFQQPPTPLSPDHSYAPTSSPSISTKHPSYTTQAPSQTGFYQPPPNNALQAPPQSQPTGPAASSAPYWQQQTPVPRYHALTGPDVNGAPGPQPAYQASQTQPKPMEESLIEL